MKATAPSDRVQWWFADDQAPEERSRMNWIIGCDLHARYQQIAALDPGTGALLEHRLNHVDQQVQQFYSGLPRGAVVGIEASGPTLWFEQVLENCGHQLWVGHPAAIRAAAVRKQKTDARDARLLLDLLLTDRFPRIWLPTAAERDLRQLLLHRHKLVRWRTQLCNQLAALARAQGLLVRRHWTQQLRQQLVALPLDPWAARRRQDLLNLLDRIEPQILELTQQVEQQAKHSPAAVDLMQLDGVGPIVSLAFLLTLGTARRFARGKQVASYLGLNPTERSSGQGPQKLGHISKQGNRMMRWLLVEAAWVAVGKNPELRRFYQRLTFRRGSKPAIVAAARKLAVQLYWRLREFENHHPQPPAPMQGSSGRELVQASTL
jgi:transposase